jgi:O-antigen/teichoic acid export membrane protein
LFALRGDDDLRSAVSGHVRRAGILAVAGGVANAANVIVTVVIARLLSSREYGALAVLVGLFFVLSMPGSALVVAVVRRTTEWEHLGRGAEVRPWVDRFRRRLAVAVALAALAGVALRSPIGHLLGLPGPSGVAEVVLAGGGWLLLCIDRGLLQARRAYTPLARNLIVEGATRTVLTVGLIAAGLGVDGAALGLVAAMVLSEADARRSVHRLYPVVPGADVAAAHTGLVRDAVAALSALGFLAALQSLDVVILGRDAPHQSGAYAAVSVTSKSLVYAALVLSAYLLPEAAVLRHAGERAHRQLVVALGIVAIPAVLLLGLAVGASRPFIRLVFGAKLATAAPALTPLVAAMACLAATVLFTHYLLAVGSRAIVGLLAAGLALAVGLLAAAHGHPQATARADLVAQASLAACAALLAWRLPVAAAIRAVTPAPAHVPEVTS